MSIILIIQAVLAVLIILGVLMQQRAAGLTATGGGMNTALVQRRGAEKVLYQATIAMAVVFAVLTILQWYV